MRYLFWGAVCEAVIGGASFIPAAHADPMDSRLVVYAAKSSSAVCETLEVYPTFAGVAGVLQGIQSDGFTAFQSGEIIVLSVEAGCPSRMPLLQAFANSGGTPAQVAI
jgi:hypothetical protein